MKDRMLLVTPLAAYLAHTAVAQGDIDLLYACENLTIDTDTGVLSGECYAGENPALTSVDLDACLGWGTFADPRNFHDMMPVGSGSGLAPAENGNFTKNCSPCYLISTDEVGQAAAQLMCNCSPEGSDFKTEYSLDLTDLVSVTKDGCLQCMGARGDCAPEVPLDPSRRFASGDLDRDGFNDMEELLDWLELRAEAARTPCETQITTHPRLLPATFFNTTHHRCKGDHSLCCYQARGSGCLSRFEAFLLIEANKYWYRMHYAINYLTFEIESLGAVFQLCQYPGQCEEESTPDDTSGVKNCTWNPLKRYENKIYDKDSDALPVEPQAPLAITLPLTEMEAERALLLPTPVVSWKPIFRSKRKYKTRRRRGGVHNQYQ